MAIALALLGAVAYGLADFVGGVFSTRVNPWAVALMAQLGGAAVVLVASLFVAGSPDGSDLAWTGVAGLGNGIGTAFLYRGLSSGRMGVVSPVSGVGAALLPVLVGVSLGERPGALVWLGIVTALPGIWLVAHEPGPGAGAGSAHVPSTAVVDGVLAGLGFGTLFAALAQIGDDAGLLPLALNQLIAGVAIVVVASVLRVSWLPREPRAAAGLVSGVLGALATGAFMISARSGLLSVSAVITSLYPAVTVLLAASMLRERVHATQACGLVFCAAAVVLVAAG